MIYTFLFIQERDLSKSIYVSQVSNTHIAFVDEDLYFFSSPFDPSGPIPYWIRSDTLFFGLSHEMDFAIFKSSQWIELGNERFELLTKKNAKDIFHYIELIPMIREEASEMLEKAHSNIPGFRVGNITISQKNDDDYNELNLEAVCRYRDSDGINRGFKAKMTCSIEADRLKIDLLD